MKLLLTGIDAPDLIGSWSGIPYHLAQSLRAQFEVCCFGGLEGRSALFHQYVEKFHRRLKLGGSYRIRSEPGVLQEFARRMEEVIEREEPDAIVSISCEPIAYLKTGLPVYMIYDATFRLVCESYRHFQILSPRSRRKGEEAQRRGFERATVSLAASKWARDSAVSDYGVPATRAKVVPMGANLVDPPTRDEVSRAIDERIASGQVQFLFIGVEWERKGGDTAVAIVESLIARGVNAQLHLVGCEPPEEARKKAFVVSHGFLSKNNPEQAAKLRSLFLTANFFIVPSTAECFGCVFCEAAAFGVPTIARETGGIPEIVTTRETGFLLSKQLSEEMLVEQIYRLTRDPAQYREMALSARADYETRLNWDAYTMALKEMIEATLPNRFHRTGQLASI